MKTLEIFSRNTQGKRNEHNIEDSQVEQFRRIQKKNKVNIYLIKPK